jgi:hypothetical protein
MEPPGDVKKSHSNRRLSALILRLKFWGVFLRDLCVLCGEKEKHLPKNVFDLIQQSALRFIFHVGDAFELV